MNIRIYTICNILYVNQEFDRVAGNILILNPFNDNGNLVYIDRWLKENGYVTDTNEIYADITVLFRCSQLQ